MEALEVYLKCSRNQSLKLFCSGKRFMKLYWIDSSYSHRKFHYCFFSCVHGFLVWKNNRISDHGRVSIRHIPDWCSRRLLWHSLGKEARTETIGNWQNLQVIYKTCFLRCGFCQYSHILLKYMKKKPYITNAIEKSDFFSCIHYSTISGRSADFNSDWRSDRIYFFFLLMKVHSCLLEKYQV